MKRILIFICLLNLSTIAFAQRDTIRLDFKNINTGALKMGPHSYLVYFRNGKDSSRVKYQFWRRNAELTEFRGKKSIRITQQWEDNDTVLHTAISYCDLKTFCPVYQEVWWRSYGTFVFDFGKKEASVLGSPLMPSDTAAYRKKMYTAFERALKEGVFNWHLDLEIFSMLPFREHATYAINFYDPGQSAPQIQYYTLASSGSLKDFENKQMDCWLLQHGSGDNLEIFWISKQTKEVVKLQQRSGDKYRFKVMLPFAP